MQTPLVRKESGGGSSSSSSIHDSRKIFHSRTDAISHGSAYQRAAALVDLAEDGIGLPEQVLDESRFERASKFYFIFIRFDWLWSLNLFALIVLNFLEKPLWCAKYIPYTCHDREYFYLGELPYLTSVQSLVYEGITLLILVVHTFFPVVYEGCRLYWKNPLNILKVAFLLVLVSDLLVYALLLSPVSISYLPLRVAPYIRVAFVVLNVRELRACMVTLAGMMGMYLNVLALWSLFILFSSWLAYVIFEDTQQAKMMFNSYGATLYQMFVLFTTSNNPDVWIPAYKTSRWSSIFFVLYVLLGVYFLTNLILAVVYDSFKDQLAKQIFEMDSMRTRMLKKAFSLVDNRNLGYLDKMQCIRLFEELSKYRTLPNISREDFELIFDELDHSGDFKINLDEFTDLCNAIALRFQKGASPSWFEYCPSFYHSPLSEKLKAFVRSNTFGYIIAAILLLNLAAVIIETTLDIENDSAQSIWQEVEFFFVIGETATLVIPHGLPIFNGEWIRYLLIARMLRLIRLLMHVQRYRAFVATFLTLIPSLMPYLGTIFCVLCIYCSLGLQLFGGIVNSGNPKLGGTDLSDNEYPSYNAFLNYPSRY